jgi:endonuclease/exonuclease/phosphatase family metal-dependent hydrolase
VLAILGPWAQHVSKVSCDDLGRWVSATLTGTDGDSFTLFSLYNVVDTTLQEAGPSTVFAQLYRLLRLVGVTHPNPRKQCVGGLQRVIAQLVHNDEKVVVVGDFNELLGHDPGLMASVCAANHLFDVHPKFHGEVANIPTYTRSSKRLDYCAASASLEPYVAASGFNLFNECIHSDH